MGLSSDIDLISDMLSRLELSSPFVGLMSALVSKIVLFLERSSRGENKVGGEVTLGE